MFLSIEINAYQNACRADVGLKFDEYILGNWQKGEISKIWKY